jgi:hypothetical protein
MTTLFSKRRSRSKNTRTASQKDKHWRRAAGVRLVLAGYPVKSGYMDKEQIESYLSGDKITCLLCGKNSPVLSHHIKVIHNVTPEEYKQMYGLPFSIGLAAGEWRKLSAERSRQLVKDGKILTLESRGKFHGVGKRVRSPYFLKASKENLKKAISSNKENYKPNLVENVCENCGKIFITKKYLSHKMCSKKCSQETFIPYAKIYGSMGGKIRAENAKRDIDGKFKPLKGE